MLSDLAKSTDYARFAFL